MKYFQLLQLIPVLIELIKLVETMLPEPGQGQNKLSIVRQMVEQAYGDVTSIWPQLQALIEFFVKLSNLAGTFKKA